MARRGRRRSNTGIPGLSYSWRRATGVTSMKRKIARSTGIPTTRAGRQRKFGKMMSCGCLTLSVGLFIIVSLILVFVLIL